MTIQNLNGIKQFLMKANMLHASGTADVRKEEDGSRTITYAEGDYRMDDNFFGGEPYGGRLVVFYKGLLCFIEAYYGWTSKPVGEVYDFLRESLKHPDDLNPFRGPAEYKKDELTYKCTTEGDVERHIVKESIYEGEKEIYSATFVGGLVDQNAQGAM